MNILRKIIPTSTPRFGGSVPGGGGLRLPRMANPTTATMSWRTIRPSAT